MKDNKDEDIENINTNFIDISSRLVIKNIPHNLSDTKLIEIIKKNFEDHVKNDILICKLEKKYSMKGRNKLCYITVDNLETRNKVYEFFSTFELIDPRGIKQKLTVNDAIYQSKTKPIDDPICNTIDSCEHFLKFKEYFSNEKFVDFKNDESKFCDNLFDGITLTNNYSSKEKKNNSNPSKMIIIKKDSNNVSNDIKNNEVQENQIENIIVENNNNRNRYGNNKIRNYNNNYYDKGKNKDNYYNNKKDNYYNDYNNYENQNNKKDNYYNDYNNNYEHYNNKKDNYYSDYNNNYYGKYNNYNRKNGYRNKGYK